MTKILDSDWSDAIPAPIHYCGNKTAWAPENEFLVKERCGIASSQSESSILVMERCGIASSQSESSILVTWYKWTN